MSNEKIFSGSNEDEIWQQLNDDLSTREDLLEYTAVINQLDHRIILSIEVDPGGGFEGGYELTTLSSVLPEDDFKFVIHHEGFLDEIGKFFGMQDVEIGYPEFDKKVIVKTNDESKMANVFQDEETRKTFKSLNDYRLGITHHNGSRMLEFTIDLAIADPIELRKIYHAFINVLNRI